VQELRKGRANAAHTAHIATHGPFALRYDRRKSLRSYLSTNVSYAEASAIFLRVQGIRRAASKLTGKFVLLPANAIAVSLLSRYSHLTS